jgi:hypothetical protein
MSPAAIKAVFSPDSDADLILLLTVYNPADPSEVVLRIADGYTGRITALETPDEVVYGVRSRGQDFIFLPMEISLPSEEEAQAPRCSLVLNDVSRYAIPIVRTITGPPKILMELVLSTSPDVVETSFAGFYINSFTYNAESVSGELAMIDYEREPFPQHSFSPAYFPGMF